MKLDVLLEILGNNLFLRRKAWSYQEVLKKTASPPLPKHFKYKPDVVNR